MSNHGHNFRTLDDVRRAGLRIKGDTHCGSAINRKAALARDAAITAAEAFTTETAKPINIGKPRRKGKLLSIAIFLPIRIHSEANDHQKQAAKWARAKKQGEEVAIEWCRLTRNAKIELPCIVRITRIGQKKLDDDNLANGCKKLRDSIAKALGVDDGSDRIRFEYGQEATGKREYGVRVEVVSI